MLRDYEGPFRVSARYDYGCQLGYINLLRSLQLGQDNFII